MASGHIEGEAKLRSRQVLEDVEKLLTSTIDAANKTALGAVK